jgi:protein-S-isoprenylcysteine O-methyltransferase Ste14
LRVEDCGLQIPDLNDNGRVPAVPTPPSPVRLTARVVLAFAVLDAMLFGVAGRTDWLAVWLLTALCLVTFTLVGAWMLRRDPDLLNERSRRGPNVPPWDRAIMAAYRVLLAALFVTAALDAGRFRWSDVPVAVQALGLVAIVATGAVITWCVSVNHFLSSDARIQSDRGHTVVRDGPYRSVRHPMYGALIAGMIGLALFLGSWLALLPAALIAVLFVVRTSLEDRMLADGLFGYREYAAQVPRRLVPGVW